jgi:flagellar protein FliT
MRDDPTLGLLPAGSTLLRHYEALDGASEQMLRAARAGDWDSVCRLEGACALVIARLRALVQQQPLTQQEQAQRQRILQAILTRDAEIRRLADPWPHVLDPMGLPVAPTASTLH